MAPDPRRRRPRHRGGRAPPGWPLQVGFNRRFAADFARRPRRGASTGAIGTPQLMRSLTRDPGLADPGRRAAVDDLPADPDPRLRHPALAQPGRRAGRGLRHRRRAGRPRLQGRRPARHRGRRHHLRQRRHRGRRGQLLRAPTATTSAARCSGRTGMVTAGRRGPHLPGAAHARRPARRDRPR